MDNLWFELWNEYKWFILFVGLPNHPTREHSGCEPHRRNQSPFLGGILFGSGVLLWNRSTGALLQLSLSLALCTVGHRTFNSKMVELPNPKIKFGERWKAGNRMDSKCRIPNVFTVYRYWNHVLLNGYGWHFQKHDRSHPPWGVKQLSCRLGGDPQRGQADDFSCSSSWDLLSINNMGQDWSFLIEFCVYIYFYIHTCLWVFFCFSFWLAQDFLVDHQKKRKSAKNWAKTIQNRSAMTQSQYLLG